MEQSVVVVVEPPRILAAVCGSCDSNLKAIERFLGAPVTVRGNEARMDGLDAKGAARFRGVMESLMTAAAAGEEPGPEYVRAALDCDGGGEEARDRQSLRRNLIAIPRSTAKVFPRSAGQAAYIQGMLGADITFCVGPAGTGKTFLAVSLALSFVLSKKTRKLVLTRPVVEAGESLGFLPGDLAQKINPYLRPLYDAMEMLVPAAEIHRLEDSRIIEIAPLAYMRGRSLNDAFIILDEAQNTTKEQMKMFLTRLGRGSKAVVTGDATQIDLPARLDSGLLHALSILNNIEGIHISYLNTADVVRHPLVKKIIGAYDAEKGGGRL